MRRRNAMKGLLRQRLQEEGKKNLWRWRKKQKRMLPIDKLELLQNGNKNIHV